MSVSIESLPDEDGVGTFFYVGKKWDRRTHIGRLATLRTPSPSARFALYDRSGAFVGVFLTPRAAKAKLRELFGLNDAT